MTKTTKILKFNKCKVTYNTHKEKMISLKQSYKLGKISYAEAYILFLNHLEETTGVRPYLKQYEYEKKEQEVA